MDGSRSAAHEARRQRRRACEVAAETLAGALEALDYADAVVATALNGEFVPGAKARRNEASRKATGSKSFRRDREAEIIEAEAIEFDRVQRAWLLVARRPALSAAAAGEARGKHVRQHREIV